MAFRHYANCIYCGTKLDVFGDDEFDGDCGYNENEVPFCHDYDVLDPMGELQ